MFRVYTARQAQCLDAYAIHRLGIPSCVLMENAGYQASQEILKILMRIKDPFVCVVCGSGNNGGDGFVAARHIFDQGIPTKVFFIGNISKLKEDPSINYHILKKIKCPLKVVHGLTPEILRDLKKASLVVDAIFGIGLTRPVQEPLKSIIDAINRSRKKVVALDIPSGLDATTGEVLGACVKASQTITFAVMKKGLLSNDGPAHAGKITIADIGIPGAAEKKMSSFHISRSYRGS